MDGGVVGKHSSERNKERRNKTTILINERENDLH
jgi:hypothetical protein